MEYLIFNQELNFMFELIEILTEHFSQNVLKRKK